MHYSALLGKVLVCVDSWCMHMCIYTVYSCVFVRVYRLPAVPLHGAVVVSHHPWMVQQLSNTNTPLGVHLQDTHRNYNLICNSPQSANTMQQEVVLCIIIRMMRNGQVTQSL